MINSIIEDILSKPHMWQGWIAGIICLGFCIWALIYASWYHPLKNR